MRLALTGVGARRPPPFVSRLLARLSRARPIASGNAEGKPTSKLLDHYVAGPPSLQNAIDLVPGWVGQMPPETGLVAGSASLYADTRIAWLLSDCYAVSGKAILELGPLEAFHTFMLHRAGAASIDAIEANSLAFLRCLVTKEALTLDRARFYLGDFLVWLEQRTARYDLIVASGVLYHSHDPVRLLRLICERANSFYLWTHYFDEIAMPRDDPRRVPFSDKIETQVCRGVTLRLHERSYRHAWRDPSFCGGLQDTHYWIDRDDILKLIAACGFDDIKIADDQPEHVNGPSFSVFATRVAEPPSDPPPDASDPFA